MAKRISSDELCWLVTDALHAAHPNHQTKISVAIVPDKSSGWRTVIANRHRAYMTSELEQELAKIEQRLRRQYSLAVD